MPRYRFTGAFETVLHGLAHGINAVLHRSDEAGEPADHGQPDESTVVVQPGDEVETDEAYPHAQLVNVETGEPDPQPALGDDAPPPTVSAGLAAIAAAGQSGAEGLAVLQKAADGAAEQQHPGTGEPMTAVQAEPDGTEHTLSNPPEAEAQPGGEQQEDPAGEIPHVQINVPYVDPGTARRAGVKAAQVEDTDETVDPPVTTEPAADADTAEGQE